MNDQLVTTEQPITAVQVMPQSTDPYMRLIELAVVNNSDLMKLEKLMDLQERYDRNVARKAFFEAMAKFQSEIPIIKKSKLADFGTTNNNKVGAKYKYASLDDIAEAIKPFLQKHGFSYRFEQFAENNLISVTFVVTHFLGHSESNHMSCFADTTGGKNAIQALASSNTYLRRYTLTAGLGIATADEDIDGRLPEETKEEKDQQRSDEGSLRLYPDAKFKQMLAKTWGPAIKTGRSTHKAVIDKLASLYDLTDAQIQEINSVEAPITINQEANQ